MGCMGLGQGLNTGEGRSRATEVRSTPPGSAWDRATSRYWRLERWRRFAAHLGDERSRRTGLSQTTKPPAIGPPVRGLASWTSCLVKAFLHARSGGGMTGELPKRKGELPNAERETCPELSRLRAGSPSG